MTQYFERLQGPLTRRLPEIVFLLVSLFIFREVFWRGYVLDGNWDRREQGIPFHELARQSFRIGEFPTWNPYIFCGSSFLFSTANLSFYPANWLVYCCPRATLPHALTWVVMGHMFLSGVFTYLLLHAATQSILWRTTLSVAFMLSSSMVMNAATEMTYYGLVILPAILYVIGSIDRRSVAASISMMAAGYALLIVSGVANVVIYGLAVALAYCVYSVILAPDPSLRMRRAAIATSAFVLGCGLTAVRTSPFFHDAAFYLKDKTTYARFLDTGLTPWQCFLRLFMPHFFGDKTYPTTVNALLSEYLERPVPGVMNNYEAFSCYVGVVPALLLAYSLCFIWNRNNFFWKLAYATTLLTVFGSPLAFLHYKLTGSTNVHFGRLAMLLPLYTVFLAAEAADSILSKRDSLRRFLMFAVICVVVVWVSSQVLLHHINSGLSIPAAETTFAPRAQSYFLVVSALFVALLSIAYRFFETRRAVVAKACIALLAGLDVLWTAGIDRNFSRDFLSPASSVVLDDKTAEMTSEITRDKKYRVLGLGGAFGACKSIWCDTYNITGLDQSAPGAISDLYWYPNRPSRMEARSVWPNRDATMGRVLQMTSTALVILDDRTLRVDNPLPRWSLYNHYIVCDKSVDALESVVNSATDVHKIVVLDEVPPIEISAGEGGNVALVQESPTELTFRVDSPVNSLLLLTDTHYPGWTAFIDTEPAVILRANVAFRAVAVPAGEHVVRFRFVHPSLRIGLVTTVSAFVVWGGIIVWCVGSTLWRCRTSRGRGVR